MKRKPLLLLLIAALSPIGCAEFDGYYDDNNRDHYRMSNWSDNAALAEQQKETPSADSHAASNPRN